MQPVVRQVDMVCDAAQGCMMGVHAGHFNQFCIGNFFANAHCQLFSATQNQVVRVVDKVGGLLVATLVGGGVLPYLPRPMHKVPHCVLQSPQLMTTQAAGGGVQHELALDGWARHFGVPSSSQGVEQCHQTANPECTHHIGQLRSLLRMAEHVMSVVEPAGFNIAKQAVDLLKGQCPSWFTTRRPAGLATTCGGVFHNFHDKQHWEGRQDPGRHLGWVIIVAFGEPSTIFFGGHMTRVRMCHGDILVLNQSNLHGMELSARGGKGSYTLSAGCKHEAVLRSLCACPIALSQLGGLDNLFTQLSQQAQPTAPLSPPPEPPPLDSPPPVLEGDAPVDEPPMPGLAVTVGVLGAGGQLMATRATSASEATTSQQAQPAAPLSSPPPAPPSLDSPPHVLGGDAPGDEPPMPRLAVTVGALGAGGQLMATRATSASEATTSHMPQPSQPMGSPVTTPASQQVAASLAWGHPISVASMRTWKHRRVKVWWEGDAKWFEGKANDFSGDDQLLVVYDDGDLQWHSMLQLMEGREIQVQLLATEAEMNVLCKGVMVKVWHPRLQDGVSEEPQGTETAQVLRPGVWHTAKVHSTQMLGCRLWVTLDYTVELERERTLVHLLEWGANVGRPHDPREGPNVSSREKDEVVRDVLLLPPAAVCKEVDWSLHTRVSAGLRGNAHGSGHLYVGGGGMLEACMRLGITPRYATDVQQFCVDFALNMASSLEATRVVSMSTASGVHEVARDLLGLDGRLEVLESCAPCQWCCLNGTRDWINHQGCVSWLCLVRLFTQTPEYWPVLPSVWVMENSASLLDRDNAEVLRDISRMLLDVYQGVKVARMDEAVYGLNGKPTGMIRKRVYLVAFMDRKALDWWVPPQPNAAPTGVATVVAQANAVRHEHMQEHNIVGGPKWVEWVEQQTQPSTQNRGLGKTTGTGACQVMATWATGPGMSLGTNLHPSACAYTLFLFFGENDHLVEHGVSITEDGKIDPAAMSRMPEECVKVSSGCVVLLASHFVPTHPHPPLGPDFDMGRGLCDVWVGGAQDRGAVQVAWQEKDVAGMPAPTWQRGGCRECLGLASHGCQCQQVFLVPPHPPPKKNVSH